jgi:hypothetical protein
MGFACPIFVQLQSILIKFSHDTLPSKRSSRCALHERAFGHYRKSCAPACGENPSSL